MQITFIGTGGGRFMTVFQRLSTGGFIISSKDITMHVDPGPGAILRMNQMGLDPTKNNILFISHCHPDHYTDAEVIIEGMTRGGTVKRGVLVGSESVIKGAEGFEKPISNYHLSKIERVISARAGEDYQIDGLHTITATIARHSDPRTIGFKMKTPEGIIGYTSDTQLFDGAGAQFKGTRTLILNVIRPKGKGIPWHLCTEDAARIMEEAKPEMAILNHFGIHMHNQDPSKEAEWISEQTGIKTIAAKDGMTIGINEKVEIGKVHPEECVTILADG